MLTPLTVLASPRRREILRLVWRQERAAGEIHRALGWNIQKRLNVRLSLA